MDFASEPHIWNLKSHPDKGGLTSLFICGIFLKIPDIHSKSNLKKDHTTESSSDNLLKCWSFILSEEASQL